MYLVQFHIVWIWSTLKRSPSFSYAFTVNQQVCEWWFNLMCRRVINFIWIWTLGTVSICVMRAQQPNCLCNVLTLFHKFSLCFFLDIPAHIWYSISVDSQRQNDFKDIHLHMYAQVTPKWMVHTATGWRHWNKNTTSKLKKGAKNKSLNWHFKHIRIGIVFKLG